MAKLVHGLGTLLQLRDVTTALATTALDAASFLELEGCRVSIEAPSVIVLHERDGQPATQDDAAGLCAVLYLVGGWVCSSSTWQLHPDGMPRIEVDCRYDPSF